MATTINLAVVGATGAVGEEMLAILAQQNFPIGKVYALASSRSLGKRVEFGREMLQVADLATFDFSQVAIALFSAGAHISKQYAPIAAAAGCVVIDNTSYFRRDDDIPLVVPEVNPQQIANYKKRGIIANPNCSTIQMLVALKPIYDAVGISRINVCTYQAVSGSGKKAIAELGLQSANLLNGKSIKPEVYNKQIAFNALPQIDVFMDNGYSKEEMKMVWETRKILADDTIMVNPTAVRVPVFYCHSEAVHIETKQSITAAAARQLLAQAPGVIVPDGDYPTAVDCAGKDGVFVGRIRQDISHPLGLNLWVVSDNVRKGAALNSIQIAQELLRTYL